MDVVRDLFMQALTGDEKLKNLKYVDHEQRGGRLLESIIRGHELNLERWFQGQVAAAAAAAAGAASAQGSTRGAGAAPSKAKEKAKKSKQKPRFKSKRKRKRK
jgi:hypothetical protein